jgi:hypothetical protein
MRDDWISTTSSTYNDYDRFNRYYINDFRYEPITPLKVKTIKKEALPKKEKIHIFDVKDLDL